MRITCTPPYEDVWKDNVPRITDEEYQEYREALWQARRAEDVRHKIETRLLTKYGKAKCEDFDETGTPKTWWCIIGHNIEKYNPPMVPSY